MPCFTRFCIFALLQSGDFVHGTPRNYHIFWHAVCCVRRKKILLDATTHRVVQKKNSVGRKKNCEPYDNASYGSQEKNPTTLWKNFTPLQLFYTFATSKA
jgi:hypothetical protein